MEIVELEAFVVYAGEIDVIDGYTGEPYVNSHPVVDEFRSNFNEILLGYHRLLLATEVKFMKKRLQQEEAYATFINPILEQFKIKPVRLGSDDPFIIEKAILRRLASDPFFRIDALVVWDEEDLRDRGNRKPDNKYARDIRYNEEQGTWERRITTHWEVNYAMPNSFNHHYVDKRQGLNLDTNSGYHFIDDNRGLNNFVIPQGFREVHLTYPIFINNGRPIAQYEEYLKQNLLENLTYLYDPFSWVLRRNMRFRGGISREIQEVVEDKRLRVEDGDWLGKVLARFFNDITVNQITGTDEVYAFRMQERIVANPNILGNDLDLLNWNEGEERSVPYNPREIRPFDINFNTVDGARFILFDCYRRYPQQLLATLNRELNKGNKRRTGQELLKKVFTEVIGFPADEYIPIAREFQMSEFQKRLEIPWKR